jgi:hypothetical protein
MNKNSQEFIARQFLTFDSAEAAIEDATTTPSAIAETTKMPIKEEETTTMAAAIRRMTNAKIDSFGRRQF